MNIWANTFDELNELFDLPTDAYTHSKHHSHH